MGYAAFMADVTVLQHIPLFQHLSARRLKALAQGASLEHYQKGMPVFHQGQRATAMWIVLEGWVHLMRLPEHAQPGAEGALIFTITPDEAICGLSAVESDVYQVSGIAGSECDALRVPAGLFTEALRHEPVFAYEALRLCIRRLQHIAQQYGAMAEPVAQRVIRAILRLEHQFGETLPVTHRELAQMAWTTTESAIRTVSRLKRNGAVSGERGLLHIERLRDLEALLHGANGHQEARS